MRYLSRLETVCRRVTLALALGAAGAAAAPASSVDLVVRNGDVQLAATLLLPEGAGPHPAAVLMGGSGPSTRENLRPMADQIVARGWAVLVYDKRGCGGSTGDWTATSLSELADDAVAATHALASRPEVDRNRVGLWGNSNSGWVAPIAANRTDAVHFVVVFTGGGASPREVETFGYDQRLARASLPEAQVGEARKTVDAYLRYLETGSGLADLEATLAAPANRAWADALGLARVLPGDDRRKAWEWVAKYDPVPDIAKLKVPVLVLLGGRDGDLLLGRSVAGWSSGLAMAGNARSRIVVVPTASHAMNMGEHHHPGAGAPQFVPGVFDEVAAWETKTAP